ncbi:TATA-box-binding protein-associated factor RNA polymerase i subunit a-like [Plakobranchus ocellatus]|uniref:TATA-box-binding protein-associated factor RNA polymerase i subunit a-like n=1 Tax=Plakobranchus ocellatus TaxID=259542 RepID=A0AAV4B0Z3_9GAST|nr:TATA-box-binding protein-associated factor RNA polymerase i subunit a-like [Plakobranchus ocellatus]
MSDTDIQSLRKLRELLLILDPYKSKETERRNSNLLKLLKESSRKHSDYYHCQRPYSLGNPVRDIVPRFVELLRECVLTHQWDKALKLVESMSHEMTSSDTTIWKIGTTCLLQMGEGKSTLLQQFVKQVSALRSIAVVEVLVEFLLHLFTQGKLMEAKDLALDLKKNTGYNVDMRDPKRQAAQTLFEAYQGLILYVEWKQAVYRQETDDGQLLLDPSSQAGVPSSEPKLIADAAIDSLTVLKDKPGVWDIFLSRVVEMQAYYGAVEDARNILMTYASKNPKNPNSHRYLYELETKTNNRPEIREQHLKDLIKLDPCNPHCVDLYHLIDQREPSSIALLFDYLDYHHCKNDLNVLELLADSLEAVSTNPRLATEVKLCWETRSGWWPATVLREASSKRRLSLGIENTTLTDETSDHDRLIINTKRKIYNILRNL